MVSDRVPGSHWYYFEVVYQGFLPIIHHRTIEKTECTGKLDIFIHEGAALEIRCDHCNKLVALATLETLESVLNSLTAISL